MKRITIKTMALMLAIQMLVPCLALGEAATYYVNPNGGKYYHARKSCETIDEKYWGSMLEITLEQLSKEPYSSLKPCPMCIVQHAPMVTPVNRYVMYYTSPYDTAQDGLMIITAGTYRVGEELKSGIYTAEADIQCSGTLIIKTADKQPLYSYQLQGETSYTFYLGENMYVSLPEHCDLHKVVEDQQFQDPNEKVSIRQRRYLTMAEIPGNNYFVTNLQGENGYFVVSTIQAETGEEEPVRVDVLNNDIVQLNLRQQDNVFVEFVNCIVWPSEAGEG